MKNLVARPDLEIRIYGYGVGGKHRNTQAAQGWRAATSRAYELLRAQGIDPTVAQVRAEDVTAQALREMCRTTDISLAGRGDMIQVVRNSTWMVILLAVILIIKSF